MSCTTCGRDYCDGHARKPCASCTTEQACPRHTCGGCGRPDWECEGHFKEDLPESKLHVDGTLAAAQRAVELQAENASLHSEIGRMELTIVDLRTKLAEHELLFGVALGTDDFLARLLAGLAEQLPEGTPRTVDGIVGAVANIALALDAHEDASTPAFDEIAKLCGCPEWEYPGQVVRDVERVVKERDETLGTIRTINEMNSTANSALVDEIGRIAEKLRVAEAVRDDARAASQRDLELRRSAIETMTEQADRFDELRKRRDELLATIVRLSNTVPFPEEFATWESQRAKLIAEIGSLRSQVKFLSDDQMRLIEEREGHRLQREAAQTERDELRAQLAVDSGSPQPQHSTECGTAYRGCSPHCGFALAQMEEGEDPCLAHTFVGDVCRDCGLVAPRHVDGVRDESCACSPKYRELAPGVHAAYCPLAGGPT
jgi:hypothetical protein